MERLRVKRISGLVWDTSTKSYVPCINKTLIVIPNDFHVKLPTDCQTHTCVHLCYERSSNILILMHTGPCSCQEPIPHEATGGYKSYCNLCCRPSPHAAKLFSAALCALEIPSRQTTSLVCNLALYPNICGHRLTQWHNNRYEHQWLMIHSGTHHSKSFILCAINIVTDMLR